MTDNIQHIKLVNGMEIIGDVINNDDKDVFIDKPMLVDEWIDTKLGQGGITLNRLLPFSKENFIALNNNNILFRTEVHDVVKKYYYQSVLYSNKNTTKLYHQLDEAASSIEQVMVPKSNGPYIHPGSNTTN